MSAWPMPKPPETEGDQERCAICFEHETFVPLPCACRVNYCASCWDRALATSVTVRGRAQCPSCRASFRVDFDPAAGGLLFSPDSELTTASAWQARLYAKTRPVQVQLLRDYGAALEQCRKGAAASVAEVPEATSEGKAETGRTGDASAEQAAEAPKPHCVCGAALERVSASGRMESMLDSTDPGWRTRVQDPSGLLVRLVCSSLVVCDLCEGAAAASGVVWTCQKGPRTLLHPAAYDVCERCFAAHVGAAGAPALAGGRARAGGRGAVACCQSGALAVCRQALPRRWRSGRSGAPGGPGRPAMRRSLLAALLELR